MSEKITSKNLSYNSSLPPFLQRLHAQASGATGPDPLLAAHKRSVKKRSASEEAEDAPLVVDEQGNRLDVQVERDGTVKEAENDPPSVGDVGVSKADEETDKTEREKNSSIGVRKRKVGKVVGQDSPNAGVRLEVREQKNAGKDDAQVDKKVKKKAKKIKLSFDEDEDEDEG
ncbi:hypothetical protein E4U41_001890 [Claviceps citrina]|nr:hypothetical protein E4U41_001890 [Claviceps citrina]